MTINRIFFVILSIFFFAVPCSAGEFTVRKIILSRFNVKNSYMVDLPKSSPFWPEVEQRTIAFDDLTRIYVLNLWNNEMLIFNDQGKKIKSLTLPTKLYRFEHMNGSLEVSRDGKRFFVEGYDQSKKLKQIILDQTGSILKELLREDEIAWNFPDTRLCNNHYYLFNKGDIVYDENFQRLSGQFQGFADAEGIYTFDFKSNSLIKLRSGGGKIWEKRFNTRFEILGLDGDNHIYIVGRLNNNDPDYLFKLDSNGKIVSKAKTPRPFPLLTEVEKEEFYGVISENPFASFKLTCNGDVYLIFQLNKLPQSAFSRWLEGGEYFIYKFESR